MELRELDLDEWGELLPDTGFEVFHTPEALSVLDEHATVGRLRLYGGFKGEQPVGLAPMFVEREFGVTVVASPPPSMHVPHLGPLVMPTSPKQSKRERVNRTFTRELLDELGVDARTLLFVLCSAEYDDPRPYQWADQAVDVSFTYSLPVGDGSAADVMQSFSRSRRREIRNGEDLDVTVETGTVADARDVFDQTKDRFSEQNEYFGMTWSFVEDLVTALGDRARVYVARAPDGEFLSGIIALYSNDAASFWLGGVRATYENISLNTLLHWNIVRDIAEDDALASVSTYDMVGAGEYRLSKYKSKFAPDLVPYYVVESSGPFMSVAKSAYAGVESLRTWLP
ncbi:MAG: GNAT family N-acetyltransferase [Haloferacaceae archaeon]